VSVEQDLFAVIGPMVGGRVYPDVAPEGSLLPRVTYQQVGGEALTYVEKAAPSKKNGRFQVNVWSSRRSDSALLARQIENALVVSAPLIAKPLSAPVATFEEDTKLFGTRQDFSIWFEG
jgi:hypothetical protein